MGQASSGCRPSCCHQEAAQRGDEGCEQRFPAPAHFDFTAEHGSDCASVAGREDLDIEGVTMGACLSEAFGQNSSEAIALSLSGISSGAVRSKVLDPDLEMLRGISLTSTLLGAGQVWRYSPETFTSQQRMALYAKSKPIKQLDMFISHTWWTPGWRKAAALFLQSTWHLILVSWVLCVATTFALSVGGVLPLPFVYQANLGGFQGLCPMGCWILASGILGPLLVSFASLYVPCRSPVCFVDVACIHQEDPALMLRGVHGIGGFLAVTRELRVLWSPPYLSRLWCIFELAAFRKANPEGKITLAPLFIEMAVICIWSLLCLANIVFWIARSGRNGASVVAYLITVVPFLPSVHMLRKNYLAKQKLLSDMKSFDLSLVQCYNESDRVFIHSAISEWYGSGRAFTRFVQGPLRNELVAPILATNLRWPYILIFITPTFSLSMETLASLIMGGAPAECCVAWIAGMLVANNCFVVPGGLVLLIYLCDWLAEPRGSSALWNCLQSLGICIFFMVIAMAVSAASNLLVAAGMWTALAWLGIVGVSYLGLQVCFAGRLRQPEKAPEC
ncbi:amt-3 [Symbiodinium natans]|uniref:Amt-3 protein n=1 Tax=Symbiodinium natans TaxID=878477 RepID=A0A812ILX5_9DINO|nr:amt-3 [Symbiodinium natans]